MSDEDGFYVCCGLVFLALNVLQTICDRPNPVMRQKGIDTMPYDELLREKVP